MKNYDGNHVMAFSLTPTETERERERVRESLSVETCQLAGGYRRQNHRSKVMVRGFVSCH